jgi:hypothetical protein
VEAKNKFSLLRKRLEAIGLSPDATYEIIDRITDYQAWDVIRRGNGAWKCKVFAPLSEIKFKS